MRRATAIVHRCSSSAGAARRHARSGFRPEVLDDDFLNVAVAIVEIANREERVDALVARLADADQQTRRHGHTGFAREPERFEPHRGSFVGRSEMRSAALAQTLRRAFEHQPLRNRHFAKLGNIRSIENAGIDVREQSGLFEDRARSFCKIGERRGMTELAKLLARDAISQLGFVAECEQRLLAACGGAGARDREHLLQRQIRALPFARSMRERAVVTHVPAKLRERNEHFARIRDDSAVGCVSPRRCAAHQCVQVAIADQRIRLVSRKPVVVCKVVQGRRCHKLTLSGFRRCAIPYAVRHA